MYDNYRHPICNGGVITDSPREIIFGKCAYSNNSKLIAKLAPYASPEYELQTPELKNRIRGGEGGIRTLGPP